MNKVTKSRRPAFLVKVVFVPTMQQVGYEKLTPSALKYLINRFRIYYDDRTKQYSFPREHFERLLSEFPFELIITQTCVLTTAQSEYNLRSISDEMTDVLSNFIYDNLF